MKKTIANSKKSNEIEIVMPDGRKRRAQTAAGRGGRREGSGRKPLNAGKKMRSFMLGGGTMLNIKRYAKEYRVSQAVALACIVEEHTQTMRGRPGLIRAHEGPGELLENAG